MARYDSDEEKKKRKKKKKKRSRSRSVSSGDSRLSSKHKKSKKSKHHRRSPSSSPERSRRRSRSRSRRRSPSFERGRYRSRSRSRSRDRYSRRRSRSRDRRSRSYDRRSRSSSRSRRRSRYSRSLSRDRQRSKRSRSKERRRDKSPKNKATEDIPGFADMTPAEQAQARMQMALKAAAAADEKIKEQLTGSAAGTGSKTHQEQLQFSNAIKDIESSSFVQSSFVSNRSDKEKTGSKKEEEFSFGTAAEFKPDMAVKKILEVDDLSKLAHSNLCVDPEVKMDQWVERLKSLRQKKLEGEVIK